MVKILMSQLPTTNLLREIINSVWHKTRIIIRQENQVRPRIPMEASNDLFIFNRNICILYLHPYHS